MDKYRDDIHTPEFLQWIRECNKAIKDDKMRRQKKREGKEKKGQEEKGEEGEEGEGVGGKASIEV